MICQKCGKQTACWVKRERLGVSEEWCYDCDFKFGEEHVEKLTEQIIDRERKAYDNGMIDGFRIVLIWMEKEPSEVMGRLKKMIKASEGRPWK